MGRLSIGPASGSVLGISVPSSSALVITDIPQPEPTIITKEVFVEKPIYIDRPVYIEKLVDKVVEVPVEKIVIKEIEKPVEVIKEKIINREIPLEKVVEVQRLVFKSVVPLWVKGALIIETLLIVAMFLFK